MKSMEILNHRTAVRALAVLALALIPALLLAQPPGRGGRHFGHGGFGGGPFGGGLARLAEHLDLTPEQQGAIAEVSARYREDLRTQWQAVREIHMRLAEQIHGEQVDEGAIRQIAQELATAQGDQAVTQARMSQEIRKILTAEQIAQLEEMRQSRHARMEARREARRGPSGDGD